MENKENQNQLQIQLRPELADLNFAAPGMPQAPVVSRVIMSPENAKKLLFALTDNVKKYEAQFGEISPRNGKIGNN